MSLKSLFFIFATLAVVSVVCASAAEDRPRHQMEKRNLQQWQSKIQALVQNAKGAAKGLAHKLHECATQSQIVDVPKADGSSLLHCVAGKIAAGNKLSGSVLASDIKTCGQNVPADLKGSASKLLSCLKV